MSKIEKLTAIRDKIIETLITKEKVNKAKERFILKGSFFKNTLKYIFLKPFKIKEIKTPEGEFFTSENMNSPKLIAITIALSLLTTIFNTNIGFIVNFSFIFCCTLALFLIYKLVWNSEKKKISERFNQENMEKIKINLFKNFNEEEISFLLNGALNKKDLSIIFKEMNCVISENELIDIFYKLKTKRSNYITNPHNLILIINKIIDDEKKKESEKSIENEFKKTNKNIIEGLRKEAKVSDYISKEEVLLIKK